MPHRGKIWIQMKDLLTRLYNHEQLSRAEARIILSEIARGQHNPIQIASFMTVFSMRPITVAEIQGFRDAMLELAVPFDAGGYDTIDIVGTGGDGKNTFNISTLSAVVVAGAGYKVTKHGSYGVSSSVGSSDVLMAMGYEFTNERDKLLKQLEEANICFLHAPLFHPAMKEVVPIRKQLKTRTFFNMMGPLINPVQPKYQLFGTFSMDLSRLYQYVMEAEANRRFTIVYALDGYDEISLTGAFKLRSNEGEALLQPGDMGLRQWKAADLHGGDTAEEAAGIFQSLLRDEAPDAHKEVVCANAGVAIHTIHPERPLEDCIAEAKESIESNRALNTWKKITK